LTIFATQGFEVFVQQSRVTWRNPQTRRKTDVTIIGQNLEYPALTIPAINQNLGKLKSPDTFLFDRLTRGDYGKIISRLEQGKPVTTEIDRRTITVVGLFDLGASFATDGTIVTSQENFLRFFPERHSGQVTLGLIKVKPGHDPQQVVAQLQASLPPDTVASTQSDFTALEQAYWQQTTPIGIVFGFGTVMAFVVGTVLVFQILSTDVNEHLAE
jgi:putative ABC transport system permease protein